MALPTIPNFHKIDGNKSVLSNLKLLDDNWEMLKKFLAALEVVIGDISHDIDLETLIQEVLNSLSTIKMKFTLNPNISEETQTVNNVIYRLTKISNDTIQIAKNDPSDTWDLSQALFQCKDTNGNVVYPNIHLISENDNYKVTVTFNDWNNTIYDLVIL